jgi:hypothetical protein
LEEDEVATETAIVPAEVCGCCEGVTQETPQAIYNRPGLGAISYRVGTQPQFKATLLARLHSSHQPAIDSLRTRNDFDFSIALLDAFATVADVLTFYTERIANEAYLETATERRSVLEMARLVGYQLRPGVAANALLAFTIDDAPGAFASALLSATTAQVVTTVPPTVTIPTGTRVLSVPAPGQQAQTFETIEDIDARVEWNVIAPRLTQPQEVGLDAAQFVLAGTVSTIKEGDRILVVNDKGTRLRQVVNVTTVTGPNAADPSAATTVVDVEALAAGKGGYLPATLSVPSGPQGNVADIPAGTALTNAVAQFIIGKRWDADELLALSSTQGWSIDQLQTDINEEVASQATANGSVHVFQQRAAAFGHNAPFWPSLPVNLREETAVRVPDNDGGVTWKGVDPAYGHDWEGDLNIAKQAGGTQDAPTIALDTVYASVVPQSWIALTQPGKSPLALPVKEVQERVRSDFTLSTKVSVLTVDNHKRHKLKDWKIRETVILCQSNPLPLARVPVVDVVQGRTLELGHAYLRLRKGRTILITGERADLAGVTVTEARVLLSVALVRGFTVIEFDQSLNYSYVRATVAINVNVAHSTHGESVQSILDPLALTRPGSQGLLGSGDGSQAFQEVSLQFVPLTYVSGDTPTGGKSTLTIQVDGVFWKEVPFLYGHGPDERVYALSQDDSCQTTVTFGDGITGSRLPTGQHNIQANYRRGLGLVGLVGANQLSQLMTRPAGVKAVNNPLPAADAADPEGLEQARDNVTLTIRTLDRVVSLQDYADFARAFAGIGKAAVTWTWSGQQRIVLLTVAGVDGATVARGGTLYDNLRSAIAQAAEPFVSLQLLSYSPAYFQLSGSVTVMPDHNQDDVAAAVETVLRETFSFAARAFGQPVRYSEVVAAIQKVPGVQDVSVSQLFRSDASSVKTDSLPPADLPAAMPRAGGDEIFAAELLTLDPRPLGLTVTQ